MACFPGFSSSPRASSVPVLSPQFALLADALSPCSPSTGPEQSESVPQRVSQARCDTSRVREVCSRKERQQNACFIDEEEALRSMCHFAPVLVLKLPLDRDFPVLIATLQ